MPYLLIVIIVIALIFDFLNGFHDASNIVATMISSRAMSPRSALLMSAAAHFAGPFLCGVAVATTIGSEVVDPVEHLGIERRRAVVPDQFRPRIQANHVCTDRATGLDVAVCGLA